MFNKKIIIGILTIVVVLGILFFAIYPQKLGRKSENEKNVIVTGLKPSQQEYFSNQLSGAFSDVRLLEVGEKLIVQGKLEEAIEHFEKLMKDNSFEAKGLARERLINTYEKRHDYAKAYSILSEDVQKNYKVPPEHEARVPVEERLKYLKYASSGEYELAVKHARAAYEASKKEKILKTIPIGYQQRLNDLVASKGYIESLKTK